MISFSPVMRLFMLEVQFEREYHAVVRSNKEKNYFRVRFIFDDQWTTDGGEMVDEYFGLTIRIMSSQIPVDFIFYRIVSILHCATFVCNYYRWNSFHPKINFSIFAHSFFTPKYLVLMFSFFTKEYYKFITFFNPRFHSQDFVSFFTYLLVL